MNANKDIREHMEVVGSDGGHVGVVDHVEGETLKLTRDDRDAGGQHHWIPMDWVSSVDDTVHLSKNRDDAMRQWQTEGPGAEAAPRA
jgi:hypothetical protein